MAGISLVYVEDNPNSIQSLADMLERIAPDIKIIGSASSGKKGVEVIVTLKPSVGLIDIALPDDGDMPPGEINGVGVISAVRQKLPNARLLVYTARSLHYETELVLKSAMNAGALGILFKNADPEELLTAIRTVQAGRIYLPEEVLNRLYMTGWKKNMDVLAEISVRRKLIGGYLPLGLSNKEIVAQLRPIYPLLTIGHVRDNLVALYRQINVPNRQVAAIVISALQQLGAWEKPTLLPRPKRLD